MYITYCDAMTMCPRTFFPGRCVPWTKYLLDEAPLTDVSDVSRPWTAYCTGVDNHKRSKKPGFPRVFGCHAGHLGKPESLAHLYQLMDRVKYGHREALGLFINSPIALIQHTVAPNEGCFVLGHIVQGTHHPRDAPSKDTSVGDG